MPVEFRNIEAPSTWKLFPRHVESADYADLNHKLAARMQEGIATYGVMLRSVVLRREQGGLCVLDGWQMYQGCIAADVKPGFVELVGGIEPADFVRIMNDFRRHEDKKAERKRIRARTIRLKELVAAKVPIQDAAKIVGVSRRQATRDLAVVRKPLPRCERCERINATGDDCPACQLRRMDSDNEDEEETEDAKDEEKPNGTPPEPPKPALDANFVTIPEDALGAFEVACELAHICHEMDVVHKRLNRLMNARVGTRGVSPTLAQRLADCRQHLWQARATYVCPYCQGRRDSGDCTACRGEGWLSAAAFAQAPKEFQDEMRKLGARKVPI